MSNYETQDIGLAISGTTFAAEQRLLIGYPTDNEKRGGPLDEALLPRQRAPKPPMGLSIKNQSMVQIERQRSVAAKAGQMQILGSSGEALLKRGPIPRASFLGNQKQYENPSISSASRNYNDYVGRRQMIELSKGGKTQFQKELDENNDVLKFPQQSRSVAVNGATTRRSMVNEGQQTPNVPMNSRVYNMGDQDEITQISGLTFEKNNSQTFQMASNITQSSVKEYGLAQKRNINAGSVRQSATMASQVLGSQTSGGYQSTSNLRGPRPFRMSGYGSTSEIPFKAVSNDPTTIIQNDPACRRRQIAALRAHQIMNEQNNPNDARLKAILANNEAKDNMQSPQYLSQNGFQYNTEPAKSEQSQMSPSKDLTKEFDYVFIEMSNECFNSEYARNKIVIQRPIRQDETQMAAKSQIKSPRAPGITSPSKSPIKDAPNLTGLVSVKAYDKLYSSEVPEVSCHLLPSQLDHLKVLICEEVGEKKRLTSDAQEKMEIEKQNKVKEYMDDIISKLENKQRRFKISSKKKFVEDALQNNAKERQASVYVVVVNREKNYDPTLNRQKVRKRVSALAPLRPVSKCDDTSSSDQEIVQQRFDNQKQDMMTNRFKLGHVQRKPSFGSKPGTANMEKENVDQQSITTTTSSTVIPRLKRPFASSERDPLAKKQTAPLVRPSEPKFKWVTPVKVFPERYGPTKIKIHQDLAVHSHHVTHKINVFFDQANEFVRIMFKNQKASASQKLNINYALGLAKCLGIKANKEMFSEQSMKSREHLQQLKEKLIFNMYKKLSDENKDIFPTPPQGKNNIDSDNEEANEQQVVQVTEVENGSMFYKYHIGKGNNSIMVRSLFKNRYWWIQHDKNEMDKVNFMWTQIKNINHMETLLCKYPDKKAGLKQNITSSLSTANTLTMTPQSSKASKKKKLPSSDKQVCKSEKPPVVVQVDKLDTKLYNKIEDNFHMANKKALLLNMRNYYEAMGQNVFDNLPVTFHIKNGLEDPEFAKFKAYYDQEEEKIKEKKAKRKKMLSPEQSPERPSEHYQSSAPMKNVWILKPGENTNCGNGIQVARDFNEIVQIVTESNRNNKKRTCIVQKYIHNPLLIHKRKFDIRTYTMVTSMGGNIKGYVYDEGYIRTSSYEFDINNFDRLIHLTNDAVQKRDKNYGKHEPGNKMSYSEFQIYIDKYHGELNVCFERDMVPQIQKMATDVFRAVYGKIDPKRRVNTFEVFGLDFMIDDEFKPYLIEVNTNPCLELSSPLLARLIPNMLENAFKIAVDPLFPPPEGFSTKKAFLGDPCPENKFTLVFDHKVDGPVIDNLMKNKNSVIIEMDEEDLSDEEEHPDDADDNACI